MGKIVIIGGLNGDYLRQPFGQINDLIPFCDTITKLTPFCLSCKKNEGKITPAHFTKKIVKTETKDSILVGGKESYIPACRKCYLNPLELQEEEKEEFSMDNPTWLADWEEVEKNPIVEFDDDVYLHVTLPRQYDRELPIVPTISGHGHVDIPDYFDELKTLRIHQINGKETSGRFEATLCDYCGWICNGPRYDCKHCDKVMCKLCYEEKTEEDAKRNGAQNWGSRKAMLFECFSHNKLQPREYRLQVLCDGCGDRSMEHPGIWHTDDELDFCPKCWENDQEGFREVNIHAQLFETGIGSVLDWIPVLEDTDTHARVLYNMNPDSQFYHRVILVSVDDHGREGWNLWPSSIQETFNEILGKIPEFERIKAEKGQSWETHYSCPIHLLIKSINRELYLG